MQTNKATRLPNTIVIGAPRSGTTSLYFYIRQHPDIYLPIRKELHYFSYPLLAENTNGPGDRDTLASLCATRKAYERHFTAVANESIVGEISPSYLYFSQISERIQSELGDVKIIALLRNPIEKAYSQYMHLVSLNLEKYDFYSALMKEEERRKKRWGDIWRYAESSLYADRIYTYIRRFGRENVKVILMDNFVRDTQSELSDLFKFLEIESDFRPDISRVYNKSGLPKSTNVANFFARQNRVKTFFKKLIPDSIRVPIRLAILNANLSKQNGEIDEASRAYLNAYFQSDIIKLERILSLRTGWLNSDA